MLIKNARVFVGHTFVDADIEFGEKITAVGHLDGEGIDAGGLRVIPGLVDIHTHGAMNEDWSDGKPEALPTLSRYYASRGVTTCLATTMTLSEAALTAAMRAVSGFTRPAGGAKCAGVNLEGPFLSYARRGAQAADDLHLPDAAMFRRLNDASGGRVKLITVAPEEPGAIDFIREVAGEVAVSLGHTTADYDTAMTAFAAGATHVTHLYNGMDSLHHRKPGILPAALDSGASVELICDGLHIHPAVIRLTHRLFGDRLNLISDSMRCAGMPDGDYSLGGQPVIVKNRCATLRDGTIAGSSISVIDAVRNVARFGLTLEDAVYAATAAPALAAGLGDVGSIEVGKCADFVILDEKLNISAVYIDGTEI